MISQEFKNFIHFLSQAADVRNQDKEPVVALGAGTGVGTQSTQRTSTQDARARYWRLLFDNLKRAVGDIYSMCESDGDIAECKVRINNVLKVNVTLF